MDKKSMKFIYIWESELCRRRMYKIHI